jgi:hypothetical protein
MRFTSEHRLDGGLLEREFRLGQIPGILWTPGSVPTPAPLILLGHPGGLRKMYPRLVGRARQSRSGSSLWTRSCPLPDIGDPVGYSGGVMSIGIRLTVVEPRVAAAVLFAGSFIPRAVFDEAREVRIPLHVLLQWDDEGNDRRAALDLFDAFGSPEKTLNANMGGHTGVAQYADDAAASFFVRHLR